MSQTNFQYLIASVSALAAGYWFLSAFVHFPWREELGVSRALRMALNDANIEQWPAVLRKLSLLNAVAAALSGLAAALFAFQTYWLSLLKTLNAGETPGFIWLSEF